MAFYATSTAGSLLMGALPFPSLQCAAPPLLALVAGTLVAERLAVTWLLPCLLHGPASPSPSTLASWCMRCALSPFLRPYLGRYEASYLTTHYTHRHHSGFTNSSSSGSGSGSSSSSSSSSGSNGADGAFNHGPGGLSWDLANLPPGLLEAAMRQLVRRLAMLVAAGVILACIAR